MKCRRSNLPAATDYMDCHFSAFRESTGGRNAVIEVVYNHRLPSIDVVVPRVSKWGECWSSVSLRTLMYTAYYYKWPTNLPLCPQPNALKGVNEWMAIHEWMDGWTDEYADLIVVAALPRSIPRLNWCKPQTRRLGDIVGGTTIINWFDVFDWYCIGGCRLWILCIHIWLIISSIVI